MKIISSISARALAAFCFALAGVAVRAQTVIGTSGAVNYASGPSSGGGFSALGVAQILPLSGLASALAKPGPLWQAGPVALRPHLSYGVVHGTGILRIPGSEGKTTLQTLSAGVSVEVGKRTTADYTLSRKMYSTRQLSDTTDHNAQLQTGVTHDEWKLGVSGSYGSNSNILVETGGQTHEETYAVAGNISRQLGRRSELELNLHRSDRSSNLVAGTTVGQNNDYTLWGASGWLRYHFSKEFNAAVGVGAGYDEIENAPDMTHVQPQVQAAWTPTPKLSFSAEVGLERRRTRATLGRTQENARYSTSISYSPGATTTFSLGASRSVEPSYFSGQTTLSDSWNVGFQQRLLAKLFLSASASQRRANYDSTLAQSFVGRDDRHDSFNVRLSLPVVRKGSVAVFYQRSRNRSSVAIYQFTSDQIGADVSYRF